METKQSPKSAMTLAATGATLAMTPIVILALIALADHHLSSDLPKVFIAFQIIGCVIWAVGAFMLNSRLKERDLPHTSAAVAIGVVVIVAAIGELLFGFGGRSFERAIGDLSYGEAKGVGILMFAIYMAIHITLWNSTAKLSNIVSGFKTAAWGYGIITIVPVVLLFFSIIVRESHSYELYKFYEAVSIVAVALGLLAAVIAVIGWWIACSNSNDIENSVDELAISPESVNRPLDAGQKASLMSMDDARLQEIVNHPELYANVNYVGEASNILAKRRAWEEICDFTDEQLMEILQAPEGKYAFPRIDAASMELATRRAPAFVAMMQAYSSDAIRKMLADPGNYYDGYVVLGPEILAQRGEATV